MGLRWLPRFLIAAIVIALAAEGAARLTVNAAEAPVLRWHDFSSQFKVRQMDELALTEVAGGGLVIIGTSMAQQDLIPELFIDPSGTGATYNAGLNGGVPVVMEPWLIDQVIPRLRPNVVVWGLSPLDLSAVYGNSVKDAYDQAFETRPGVLAATDRWASSFSMLVSARAVLREPTMLFGTEAAARNQQAIEAAAELGVLGERNVFEVELGLERQREVSDRVSPFRLDRDDLAAIARTVFSLRESNIEVFLVELPVPERFVTLMENEEADYQLFRDAVAQLGIQLDVEVLTSGVQLSEDDFVDFTHMTLDAARRFTTDISSQISNR